MKQLLFIVLTTLIVSCTQREETKSTTIFTNPKKPEISNQTFIVLRQHLLSNNYKKQADISHSIKSLSKPKNKQASILHKDLASLDSALSTLSFDFFGQNIINGFIYQLGGWREGKHNIMPASPYNLAINEDYFFGKKKKAKELKDSINIYYKFLNKIGIKLYPNYKKNLLPNPKKGYIKEYKSFNFEQLYFDKSYPIETLLTIEVIRNDIILKTSFLTNKLILDFERIQVQKP